jgi:pimeloyl-ACP methyl ester carboxylesterase
MSAPELDGVCALPEPSSTPVTGKGATDGAGAASRSGVPFWLRHGLYATARPMLKSFGGGALFGAASGAGRPWVLALPGWSRTHRDFDAVLEGVDAIALDLPGFGAASPPPEAWTTQDYARHVAPVLAEMAPGSVVLGHSFGGRVAVHLGAAHADRVGALILTGVPLVGAPGGRRRSPFTYRLGRALYRRGVVGEARMEALRQRYGSSDYRAARGVMREVLVKAVNETYEIPLAAFPGPVELVWGDADDQVPVAVAEAALATCADGVLTVCPGVGHFVPEQSPAVLRAALERHHPAPARG